MYETKKKVYTSSVMKQSLLLHSKIICSTLTTVFVLTICWCRPSTFSLWTGLVVKNCKKPIVQVYMWVMYMEVSVFGSQYVAWVCGGESVWWWICMSCICMCVCTYLDVVCMYLCMCICIYMCVHASSFWHHVTIVYCHCPAKHAWLCGNISILVYNRGFCHFPLIKKIKRNQWWMNCLLTLWKWNGC